MAIVITTTTSTSQVYCHYLSASIMLYVIPKLANMTLGDRQFSTYTLRGEKKSNTAVNNSNVDCGCWDKLSPEYIAACCVTIQILTLNIWNSSVSSNNRWIIDSLLSVEVTNLTVQLGVQSSAPVCSTRASAETFLVSRTIRSPTSQVQTPVSAFTYQSCVCLNIARTFHFINQATEI